METYKTKKGEIRFREVIWINGKLKKSPVFRRKTDCVQWKANELHRRSQSQLYGEMKFHEKTNFIDFCYSWLKTKVAQGVSKSTYQNYEGYIRNQFEKFFSKSILQQINKKDIEAFQIYLSSMHNPKGVNGILITLKSIFKEAIKEGYLLKSPCEYIKLLKEDKIMDVYWTKHEVDQFLKANFKHELYDLFVVALNTGMRKGELAGLCWDRVDFSTNTIAVTRTRDRHELKERTKTNITRVLPMNELVRMTLLDLFKKRGLAPSEYVFIKSDKSPINPHHLYRQFNDAQKRSGLVRLIRFHDLRHTFASQYIINGGSIYDLQKFLGHTDISMTTRYAHLSMEYLQNAMKGFSLGSVNREGDSKIVSTTQELTMESNLFKIS